MFIFCSCVLTFAVRRYLLLVQSHWLWLLRVVVLAAVGRRCCSLFVVLGWLGLVLWFGLFLVIVDCWCLYCVVVWVVAFVVCRRLAFWLFVVVVVVFCLLGLTC